MQILSESACVKLWDEFSVPENIRVHCRLVAKVAVFLAEKLRAKGVKVDVELVQAAALLHDLMKFHCLRSGGDEYGQVERVLAERGWPEAGSICRKHGLFSLLLPGELVSWEEKLVFYADKRAKHAELVSIDARLDDLAARYAASNPTAKAKIEACRPLLRALERELFSQIGVSPSLDGLNP